MGDIIGTAKIISFRITRDDSVYLTSIDALRRGISTGHVALLLTFHGDLGAKLYAKYIANNKNIPHISKIDPNTGTRYYEVYVSFWPKNDADVFNAESVFRTHEFDNEASAKYSPFEYASQWLNSHNNQLQHKPSFFTDEQLAQYIAPLKLEASELRQIHQSLKQSYQKEPITLSPLKRIVAPTIPSIGAYNSAEIYLGPTVILHTSRLAHQYGDVVAAAAKRYVTAYKNWREAEVQTNNIQAKLDPIKFKSVAHIYNHRIHMYKDLTLACEENLKLLMFPDQILTHSAFMDKLEPFLTLGNPERDTVTLPIVGDIRNKKVIGLELEPMLQFITTTANNPTVYNYNVLGYNCAAVVYNTLWEGVKNSPSDELRKFLALAWYVERLHLTLTPTMIMQKTAAAEEKLTDLNQAKQIKFSSRKDNAAAAQRQDALIDDAIYKLA